MKQIYYILAFILITIICNAQDMDKTIIDNIEVEILRNYFDNGNVNKEWTQTMYDLHGYSKEYYLSGQIKRHSEYRNGKKWKIDSVWYENGKIKQVIQETEDVEIFYKLEYYENGSIKSKCIVNEELKTVGEFFEYYENGNLSFICNYNKNGQLEGKSTLYFENGVVQQEAKHENGLYYLLNYWNDESEQLIKDGKGTMVKYDEKGTLISKEDFINGLRNGTSFSYKDGCLSYRANYVNGKSEGATYFYYPNGKIKEIIHMKDGVMKETERNFPMYENPVLLKNISIKPQDRRDKDNHLIIPEIYPELINTKHILDNLPLTPAIYENHSQDLDITEVYRVTLTPEGNVDSFVRSVGSGFPVREEIEASFNLMRFDMKNQTIEGVDNEIWITFKFYLEEETGTQH